MFQPCSSHLKQTETSRTASVEQTAVSGFISILFAQGQRQPSLVKPSVSALFSCFICPLPNVYSEQLCGGFKLNLPHTVCWPPAAVRASPPWLTLSLLPPSFPPSPEPARDGVLSARVAGPSVQRGGQALAPGPLSHPEAPR